MRTEVEQGLLVLRGVRDFLAVTEIKPELGVIAKHVEELDEVIARLTADGVSQERNDRACRSLTRTARVQAHALRRVYLKPVARMGRKLFKNDPMLFRAVAMPPDRGYERLILAANAMADEAASHRASFVAAGFGENFPNQLKQAAELLRNSLDARRSHLGRRSAATLGMVQELVIGRELVRLLDALVMPWLEAHSRGQVGEWKTLTRFVRPAAVVEKAGGEAGALSASPEAHAA